MISTTKLPLNGARRCAPGDNLKRGRSSLIEDQSALAVLDRIVCSLVSDRALRQDLMQEAMIHLWQMERERPGQSTSWYLQSCRFHIQHCLASGRSVDSLKRCGARVPLSEDSSESTELFEQLTSECRELSQASARDIVATIARRLRPKERAVLHCLVDGLNTTDIARRLRLSNPTVTKYRRTIAGQAAKLGLATQTAPLRLSHRPPSRSREVTIRLNTPARNEEIPAARVRRAA